MMPLAKHFDLVLGTDVHTVLVPSPTGAIPTPLPTPFIGFLFDPLDWVPGIGSSVLVNGVPAATAGTGGRTYPPCHLPVGGPFAKPPANECVVFMGSATVRFDGEPAACLGLPVLSCHDIGTAAPVRSSPRKQFRIKSLVLPTSVVLPIPAGPPVLVGGPPSVL